MMVYNDDKGTTGICASIIDEDSLGHKLPPSSENIFVSEKVGWFDVPKDSGPSRQTFSPQWLEKYDWAGRIGRDVQDKESQSATASLSASLKEQRNITSA